MKFYLEKLFVLVGGGVFYVINWVLKFVDGWLLMMMNLEKLWEFVLVYKEKVKGMNKMV